MTTHFATTRPMSTSACPRESTTKRGHTRQSEAANAEWTGALPQALAAKRGSVCSAPQMGLRQRLRCRSREADRAPEFTHVMPITRADAPRTLLGVRSFQQANLRDREVRSATYAHSPNQRSIRGHCRGRTTLCRARSCIRSRGHARLRRARRRRCSSAYPCGQALNPLALLMCPAFPADTSSLPHAFAYTFA